MQPLLYDYNEYGERVGMRTFQTTPEGDPSHVEDTGAKTAWHFHEATGSLLRKEYADGKGPEYAYNEAGQLKERRWVRESSPQRPQRGTEAEGSAGTPARTDERLATLYEYDPATLQLDKSTATDGTAVNYEYDPDGRETGSGNQYPIPPPAFYASVKSLAGVFVVIHPHRVVRIYERRWLQTT